MHGEPMPLTPQQVTAGQTSRALPQSSALWEHLYTPLTHRSVPMPTPSHTVAPNISLTTCATRPSPTRVQLTKLLHGLFEGAT